MLEIKLTALVASCTPHQRAFQAALVNRKEYADLYS